MCYYLSYHHGPWSFEVKSVKVKYLHLSRVGEVSSHHLFISFEISTLFFFFSARDTEERPVDDPAQARTGIRAFWRRLRTPRCSMEKHSKMRFWFGWLWKRKRKKTISNSSKKSPSKKSEDAVNLSEGERSERSVDPRPGPGPGSGSAAAVDQDDFAFEDLLIEDDSEILTKVEFKKLSPSLPSRLLCCSWKKTFYSARDGFSLTTFYRLLKVLLC